VSAAVDNDITGPEFLIAAVAVNDGLVGVFSPDPDAKRVDPAANFDRTVVRSQEKSVVAFAVDCPRSLVPRVRPGYHEPVVGSRVELQVRNEELKLSPSRRPAGAFTVFRTEPEVGVPTIYLSIRIQAAARTYS
jgi:hypothetical protein